VVTVHSYKRWDISREVYVTTRLKVTVSYIASIRGEIMLNTAEEIHPSCIDDQGRYDPEPIRRHESLGAPATLQRAPISQGLFASKGQSRRSHQRAE